MKIKSNTSLSLRKFLLSALVAAPLATLPAPLWALPQTTGGNVTSSSATTTFQTTGSVLSITDPVSTRLILRWVNFGSGTSDIPAGSTLLWNLPTTTSAVLNTVSTGATLIDGALVSNGTIFILNPNGIVLGNTATVSAAGFGLSTIAEPEFFFANNGNLSYSGSSAATADIVIGNAAINVGTTGSVFVAARSSSVSGTITAGTLNISSGSGGVTLGAASGGLTLGTNGVAATTIAPAIPGTGNLVVNSNGGPVTFGANAVTIRGGTATITTAGGAVAMGVYAGGAATFTPGAGYTSAPTVTVSAPSAGGTPATATATIDTVATSTAFGQVTSVTIVGGNGYLAAPTLTLSGGGAPTTAATATAPAGFYTGVGTFSVGDTQANSTLTLNTGTGGVFLRGLSGNGQRISTNLTTGVTNIGATSRILLGAGTVTGTGTGVALTVSAAGAGNSIDSGGEVTVTGGTISLTTTGDNSGITFKGPGDLTFSTLAPHASTGSGVTLTSTTGSITLPSATTTFSGQLTVTAQTNITQGVGGTLINIASNSRTASFDAVTGSITLTEPLNNFNRLVLKNAPAGATVVDRNSVIIGNGTNVTGAASITAGGNISLGAGSGDSVRFNSTLALTATGTAGSFVTGATFTAGAGYTSAPTVAIAAPSEIGTTATAVATIDTVATSATFGQVNGLTITNPGTGYTAVPAITFTGGGFTTAATGTASGISAAVASAILDGSDNTFVFGALTLSAPGVISLDGSLGNGVGLNSQYGQINATAGGAIRLYEATTLNLGTITAPSLRAYSATGIINTGVLNIAGASEFGAGTAAAPGDITLSQNNNLVGPISILNDFALLGNSAINIAAIGAGTEPTVGTYLANNVTITNVPNTFINRIAGTAGNGLTGNLTVTAVGAGSDITFGTPLGIAAGESTQVNVLGLVALTAPDMITAANTGSDIKNVTIVAGGNVDFRSASALTVNATLTQNAAGNTASFLSGQSITLGSINSDYTGTVRFQSGDSKAITDSVAGLRVFGPVTFASAGGITINRAGHSFGGVRLSTGSNGSAILVESGGLRLVDVSINGSGSLTATSTTGDVFQETNFTNGAAGIRIGNGSTATAFLAARATFTASNGSVSLTDVGRNNIRVPINATSSGGVTISQARNNVTLGNITTSGKLTVDKSTSGVTSAIAAPGTGLGGTGYTSAPTVVITAPNTAGGVQATATATINTVATSTAFGRVTGFTITDPGSGYTAIPTVTLAGGGFTAAATPGAVSIAGVNSQISQSTGTRLNVFDTVTLRTQGTGDIIVGNTGNRLGGVVASSGTGNITITENTTLNLKSVATAGNLTATSEANNIIDTSDATVINLVTGIANSVVVGGTSAFATPAGSVTLGLATSNYAAVGFTSSGNVSVIDSIGTTTLATSVVGGNLDVFNTAAGATINQLGALTIQGGTTFTTNSGNIDLGNTLNQFGGIRFTANTVAITENTTMNLRSGSVANGPAILNTNGNFITSGAGGSSFIGNLTINAPNGSITPGAGSLLVVGTFTVFSNVLKDLGALSKSGNLTNKDPINLGTGTYVPPGP